MKRMNKIRNPRSKKVEDFFTQESTDTTGEVMPTTDMPTTDIPKTDTSPTESSEAEKSSEDYQLLRQNLANKVAEEEENKQEVPEAPKPMTQEELLNKLREIDNNSGAKQMGEYTPKELNLEKKEAPDVWDEEWAKYLAENQYGQEKLQGKQNIEDNASDQARALEKGKLSITEQTEAARAEVEALFDERREKASADALNRGLARSTIIIKQIEAFDKYQIEEINKLNIEFGKAFAQIEQDLALLESQKEAALRNFDLEYAIKVNNRIEELRAEYQKRVDEVLQYNNEIALKEAEWNAKEKERAADIDNTNMDTNKTLWDSLDKYGADTVYEAQRQEKYDLILTHFEQISDPYEAWKKAATERIWLEQLGSKLYEQLVTTLRGRWFDTKEGN